MRNKKAQVGKLMAYIIAFVLIVMLLYFYLWTIEKIVGARGFILGVSNLKDSFWDKLVGKKAVEFPNAMESASLESWLNTPISLILNGNEEKMRMKDAVRLWSLSPEQASQQEIQETTETIFNEYKLKDGRKTYCYRLTIKSEDKETEFGDRLSGECGGLAGGGTAEYLSNGKGIVSVNLRINKR